jgi:hydroxypyruvate isomerase
MQRRNFMHQSLLTGTALLAGGGLKANAPSEKEMAADSKPFNLQYAIHDGTFKESAGDNFLDQIKFAYDNGFRAIEDNGMMGRDKGMQEKIGDQLAKLGMSMGVFVIDDGDNWKTSFTSGKKEYVDKYVAACREAVEVAKRCHARWATVVPGYFDRGIPIGIQTANVIDMLRRCVEVVEPAGLVMVIESLSDNPDLFLRYSDQGYMICKAVNSSSCKMLFDMYHMQRNEGDIIGHMDWSWDQIGYLQIGDNPGRFEPTSGEMNYKNIFKHVHEKGYKGILGMEHGAANPGKEGELQLIKAYRWSDDFTKEF